MALTRSQLLAGNQAQGVVLEGQVQAVKQGSGILIESDGTIKVNAATVEGLVRLNNPLAFNSYVWPTTSGSVGTFLGDDGSGVLSWLTPSVSSTVEVSPNQPANALIGRLWFDTTELILKVYEDTGPQPKWTPVYRGLDAEVGNTSALPDFVGGAGLETEPFALEPVSTLGGSFIRFKEIITIEGFAPYQFVPVVDLSSDVNGNRFSVSSNFTDGNGVLTFRVLFTDYPVSQGGVAYTANLEVGFGSVFISASTTITNPLSLSNTGAISGAAQVGQILNYTIGQAEGGSPPYSYEWEWRRGSDEAILQTNGDSFTVPESLDGDRVFVRLTASDVNNTKAIGDTVDYPMPPGMVVKGPFPFTNVLFPTALNQEVNTTWLDSNTVLFADGCIEITTDDSGGTVWGQGPFEVTNGGYVKTRWAADSACGGAPNGSTISGCVFDNNYRECGSISIDRLPSPFSFLPVNDLQPNTVATALPVTPVGFNGAAYVTYTGISTLTGIQGSLNNGQNWFNIPLINSANEKNFPILPGQSLTIRGTTGSATGTSYNAVINIGEGSSVQSASFVATNTTQTVFATNIAFPSTTSEGYGLIPGAASPSWVDGSTTLTATGCLDIQVESSGGTVISAWGVGPFAINNGEILRTRWKNTLSCGGSLHGTTISGVVTNGVKTSVGSIMIDRVAGAFSFQDVSGQQTSSVITSNSVVLSGFNSTTYLTASNVGSNLLTSLEASISGGSWQAIPSSGTSFPIQPAPPGSPAVTLQIRGTTGSLTSTSYNATIVVGDAGFITTDTWSVTTSEAVKTVITPSITSPVNGSTGINPTTLNPAGVNVTASAYQVINGASPTQLNSEWEVRSGSTSGTVVYTQTKTSAFTNWFIPLTDGSNTVIQPNTQYFVRVRYRSQDGVVSSWSPFSQFTTATTFTQTWVKRTSYSFDIGFNQIANSGSLWMAVEGKETSLFFSSARRVVTSPDAITWSQVGSLSVNDGIEALAFGNGVWLTVGSGSGSVRRSNNNGASWVTPTNSGLTTATLLSIAHGNGTFVAVGGSVIQTTTDGNTWTTRPTPANVGSLSCVIWDGSNFIAVGNSCLIYSPTGTSWTRVNTPQAGTYLQIAYLPGATPQYILLRPYFTPSGTASSSTTAYTSTNFTSWTAQTLPSGRIQYASAGNGVFAIGDWQNSGGGLNVWTSPSGATGTWTKQTLPTTTSNYHTHYLNYGTTSTGIGRFVLIDHDWNIFSTT